MVVRKVMMTLHGCAVPCLHHAGGLSTQTMVSAAAYVFAHHSDVMLKCWWQGKPRSQAQYCCTSGLAAEYSLNAHVLRPVCAQRMLPAALQAGMRSRLRCC